MSRRTIFWPHFYVKASTSQEMNFRSISTTHQQLSCLIVISLRGGRIQRHRSLLKWSLIYSLYPQWALKQNVSSVVQSLRSHRPEIASVRISLRPQNAWIDGTKPNCGRRLINTMISISMPIQEAPAASSASTGLRPPTSTMVPRYRTMVHSTARYRRAQPWYSSVPTPLYCTAPYFATTGYRIYLDAVRYRSSVPCCCVLCDHCCLVFVFKIITWNISSRVFLLKRFKRFSQDLSQTMKEPRYLEGEIETCSRHFFADPVDFNGFCNENEWRVMMLIGMQ